MSSWDHHFPCFSFTTLIRVSEIQFDVTQQTFSFFLSSAFIIIYILGILGLKINPYFEKKKIKITALFWLKTPKISLVEKLCHTHNFDILKH